MIADENDGACAWDVFESRDLDGTKEHPRHEAEKQNEQVVQEVAHGLRDYLKSDYLKSRCVLGWRRRRARCRCWRGYPSSMSACVNERLAS